MLLRNVILNIYMLTFKRVKNGNNKKYKNFLKILFRDHLKCCKTNVFNIFKNVFSNECFALNVLPRIYFFNFNILK